MKPRIRRFGGLWECEGAEVKVRHAGDFQDAYWAWAFAYSQYLRITARSPW